MGYGVAVYADERWRNKKSRVMEERRRVPSLDTDIGPVCAMHLMISPIRKTWARQLFRKAPSLFPWLDSRYRDPMSCFVVSTPQIDKSRKKASNLWDAIRFRTSWNDRWKVIYLIWAFDHRRGQIRQACYASNNAILEIFKVQDSKTDQISSTT